MLRRGILYIALIFVCIGVTLFVEWLTTPSPSTRKIHLEAFRYGTSPAIIRANRGDQLILTFSTRDTGHSFFLQDYRIDAKISPASETIEVRDPLQPTEPPAYVREIHLKAGLTGLWGNLVSISRFRCHVYCGPMHGFEQGDLVVRPNWLLVGSMGLLLAIVIIGWLRVKGETHETKTIAQPPIDLNKRFVLLDRLLKWRPLQFTCTLPVLAGLMVMVLAGLLGTKVGGRNVAVMLTWIVWISMLALFLVPLGGRIWCMICPLPVLGEYLQRGATTEVRAGKRGRFGNRFFGSGRHWPRALSGPWLRLCFFLILGTLSASLAGQPKWTAITLMIMVVAGIFMSLVWELRSFCRYVCPVAAFISAYSTVGRLMVRKRAPKVCRTCKDKPCFKGNATGWACPYGLMVARIDRNADCGMCTECFKSCPNDNVSFAWRRGPWTDHFRSYGEAWQAIVLLVLAIAYSLTVHSPWPVMRDMVNIVDKTSLPEFGLFFTSLCAAALGFVPLVFWLMCGLGLWLSEGTPKANNRSSTNRSGSQNRLFNASVGRIFKRTLPALLPLGLALWAVFFVETIMANMTFILLSFSDPFGWGWDLFGTAGMPWIQIWPSKIPWIQVGLILAGVTLSFKKGYRLWNNEIEVKKNVLRGFAPTAVILLIMTGGMLIYFTHY
ncbi:MAG: 4Fe-4S binding protein [Desulfobacteraceae bacterium]|nr:4Fe-4S binding protein [Desulfobacteraceae bacterium]